MPFFASGTATDAKTVTPHDTNDLSPGVCNALWIGGAGDVAVITAAGTTLTLTAPVGLLPLQVSRVKSTGTTATAIAAFY
jgi:hypothetical protein